MLTLEALIFYSTSLFIVMVVELTETHSYSTENEPLNFFARKSQNSSITNMTAENPIYTPANKYSFLTSFASLKILSFSTPKYQNGNIIKKRDLIYAKPYGISLGYLIDISQNAQMHNLKRYRRRTRKEDRFHCKNCRNIAADGRGKSEFFYSNKKKRTSTKPVAFKGSSNLEDINQEKQAFSNLPESFKKTKDSVPDKFSNEQGKKKGIKKQSYISGNKMLNGHKEIKRVNNTQNSDSRKITLKPKYGPHKLQKVNPIDDTKRHTLVADKNFAVMKGYPHTMKTFKPYKNSNVTQDYSDKSKIRKQKTTVQFKHQASNGHKKLVNSKLGKTIPANSGKVNMAKSNHGEVKKGDSFVNGHGKSMRIHTDKKNKLNVNNYLENQHKTQYIKNAKSLTGRSNKKNESLSKNIILNESRKELEESNENNFHTVRSQSKHTPEIKNASRTSNILKKVKSKRKVGLHRNFNLKNNIKSKENNTSVRRSRFLKGFVRNLRNVNEGALHDIKDFILKHFPENKRKRTIESHISKSEFSKPSKGILNEIKEFVLNNFQSDKTKRNSPHILNSSKHGKYIPKKRYFDKIHQATNKRSSNSLNIPEALKLNTNAKTLEKGISQHSNFDENVTDNVTDSDNNRSKSEVTGFARRDVQSVSYSVSTSTSVSVSDSTVNEQATVIGDEEISTNEFDSNTVSLENLTDIVNDENSEGEIDYQDAEAINNQSTTTISSNKADELTDGEENTSLKSSIITSPKHAFTSSNERSFLKGVSGYKKLNNSKREMALRSPEEISDRLQISDNSSESSILNANPNLNPVTAGSSHISQLNEIISTSNTDTFKKSTAENYNQNATSNLSSDILISSENIQISSTVQTRHKADTMPNNYHSSNPDSNSSASASTLKSFMDTSTMDYSVGKRSQVKNQIKHSSTVSGSYLSTILKSKKRSKVSREAKSDESRDYDDQLTSIPTSSFSSSNVKDNDYELELKSTKLSNSLESVEATDENYDEYQDLEAVHNENDKKISINSREDKQEEDSNKDTQYDDDAHAEISDSPANLEKTNHKKYIDSVKGDLKEDNNKEEYEYDDKLSYTETPEPIDTADDKSFNSDYSTERILNKSNQEYEYEDTSEPNNSEISDEGITGRKSFRFPEPEIQKISLQEDETEVKENATYRSDRDAKNYFADQLALTSGVLTSTSPRVHKKHKENSLKSSKRNEMLKNKLLDSNLDTVETSTVNEANIHSSEIAPSLAMQTTEGYRNETEEDYTEDEENTEDDYDESGSEYSNDEVNMERTKNNAVNPSNREGEMNLKNSTISSESNEYEEALEDGEYDVPHVTYTASLQNTRIKPEISTMSILDSKFSSEEPEPSIWPTEVNQNINDSEEEYDYETTNAKLEPLNNMGKSKTSKLKFNDNKSMLEDKFTPINNKETRKYISEAKDDKSPVSSPDESEKYLDSDTLLNDDEDTDLLRMKKEQEDENGENEMNPISNSSSPVYADLEKTTAPDRYLDDDLEGTILYSNGKEEGSEDEQPSKIDSTPTAFDDTEDESNPVRKDDTYKSDSVKADDMEKIFDSQNVDESEDFSLKKAVREENNTTLLDISKENAYISEDELITSTDLSFVSSYGEQLKDMPSKYYSGDTENGYDVDGRLNDGGKDDLESELIVENSEHFNTQQEIRNKTKRGEDNSSSLQKLKRYLNTLIRTKQKKIKKRHHDTADIRKIHRTRKILGFEPPTMSDVNANSSLLLNNWLFGTATLLISLAVLIGI